MAHITTHYDIAGPVPFLDVDVSVDNRIFLDPHAIRLQQSPEPYVSMANEATESFFHRVSECALSENALERRDGLHLLQRFVEPWETRLGLARSGFSGHGGAEDVGRWIWDALTEDVEALLRIGVLCQIEDLPLFVEGIDRDITSDVTTRIVFEPLTMFTAEMVATYPQFTIGRNEVRAFERQIWDSQQRMWRTKVVDLPVADGKPLLLVPRGWARRNLLMSAARYYETSVLSYAQLEQAAVSSTGKLLKTPKDALKRQTVLTRGRSTNIRVTHRAHSNDEDLLAAFKRFVDAKYEGDAGVNPAA